MDAWPRTTRGYEADVGLYHIPGERDIYLDAVLSLANPRTYPGCENKAGKVAELWARRKNAEHPVFDRQTGRRLQLFDFCALAFELRSSKSEKQALKIVRFQRHLRLAISLYVLQDLRGSSSAVGLLRIVLRFERRHH